jgi:PleD family two-component response regulator
MGAALLPITDEPAHSKAKPIRVLVIDDDACVGKAVQAILNRRRCETVLASRACAGIDILSESRFDLVLLDVFMP